MEEYGWKAYPESGKLEEFLREDGFRSEDDAVDNAAGTFGMSKEERERLRKEGSVQLEEFFVVICLSGDIGIF